MTGRTGSVRVLHVDDDPDLVETAAARLEAQEERITVETATSAGEGLERLDDGGIDCVVSDYSMPGRDGIEFLEAVREEYPDLPFVLYTGRGSEEVASEAISAGVTDYLQKTQGGDQYALLANRVINAVEAARAERERERHLEAIETAQEGIAILDEDGEFVYVNEAYADLYGYDPEEMVGEHWELIYREEDLERIREEVDPALEESGYWHGETTGVRSDGSTFVEDHTIAATERGEFVCTVRDITGRKERQRAIEDLHETARSFIDAESREQVAEITIDAVRDILDMPSNGVHLYDEETGTLSPVAWTERGEALVGEPPAFAPGEGLAWEAFEAGEPRVYEDVSTDPDRYEPDTEIRSEIILPLGDHGVLLVGSLEPDAFDETDVSLARTVAAHATTALDRIERERELREERRLVEKGLDALDDLFYVVDPDGELRRWNERGLEATGYSAAEVADMNAIEFFPEEERDRVLEAIEEALSTGEARLEADLLTADGDRIPYEFRGRRLDDADGNTIGVVGIGRDVSGREERERELQRQNERLEEFASVVSHDLRNPLNVAHGRVEMAMAECDSEHLDSAVDALERSGALIDDLLTLARQGERVSEAEPVALAETVRGCWRNVVTTEATLHVDTDRVIVADAGRLKELLENLIRNAVEHGGEDVTVTVGDLPDGFYVADDGPGIPAEERESVFDAGYSTAEEGTGFGLNIVREIAEAHGWVVAVTESEAGGARFEITGVEFVAS